MTEPWKCDACDAEFWVDDLISVEVWEDPRYPFMVSACPYCESTEAHFNKDYDPTPVEQWEVTEGVSEKERFAKMLRDLP